MNTYIPDVWVMVEIVSREFGTIRKVLSGWYGGYAGSDEWKLSSGNLQETFEDNYIVFPQESGSIYYCHKDAQRFSGLTGSIFLNFSNRLEKLGNGSSIKVIEYVRQD